MNSFQLRNCATSKIYTSYCSSTLFISALLAFFLSYCCHQSFAFEQDQIMGLTCRLKNTRQNVPLNYTYFDPFMNTVEKCTELGFKYVGCVGDDNQVADFDENLQVNGETHKCQYHPVFPYIVYLHNTTVVEQVNDTCVLNSNRKYKIGEVWKVGDETYWKCDFAVGKLRVMFAGCVAANGSAIPAGETWNEIVRKKSFYPGDHVVQRCMYSPLSQKALPVEIGCYAGGERVKPGCYHWVSNWGAYATCTQRMTIIRSQRKQDGYKSQAFKECKL